MKCRCVWRYCRVVARCDSYLLSVISLVSRVGRRSRDSEVSQSHSEAVARSLASSRDDDAMVVTHTPVTYLDLLRLLFRLWEKERELESYHD